MFQLKLFGSACIDGPDGPVSGRAVQRRRLALLGLLVAARVRGVTRDRLVALLWPDADAERARAMLSDSVYRINQAVGGEALQAIGDELRLNTDVLSCDVAQFRAAMAANEWERAVGLYAGPFLDGFYLTGANEFERVIDVERDALAHERARALEMLADDALGARDLAAAVRWARMLAAHDPLSSAYALRCMNALVAAGEPAAAIQHARVHSLLVREELGVEADPAISELAERLRSAPRASASPVAAPLAPDIPVASSAGPDAANDRADELRPLASDEPRPLASDEPRSAGAVVQTGTAAMRPARLLRLIYAPVALLLVVLSVLALSSTRRRFAAEATIPTAVAVLPLADLSPNGDQEYLADGITEELIVRLSAIDGLRVVGRTSAFALRGSTSDVREIGTRLGVTALLSGSVRRSEGRLRIVVQLTDAVTGFQSWTETYEREAADLFAIQDEIARAVVTRLGGRTNEIDLVPTGAADTDDPEAYNQYLRGRFEWHKRTEKGLRAAVQHFQLATERAPDYARAYSGLADAYAVLGFYEYMPPVEAFPRAAAAARHALELRPKLAGAHATLAYVALYHEWNWELAEAEFRRALELDPSYSTGRQWYGNFLTAVGRFDEATREMRAAQESDPLSLIANAALGWVHYYSGEHQRAVDQLSRALEINADFELAYLWRSLAHEELGNFPEQLRDAERAMALSGGSAISTAAWIRALARSGQTQRARAALQSLEARTDVYLPAYDIAKAHAALGDNEAALRWLERAHAQRSHSMAFVAVDPQLATLHGEPAYQQLVRQLRFPTRSR
jgi:TolB-like protein/DNA-binding SARP family transcriptional activator/Flp pilus assembly protein TadD